jgi:14-3-3 protein epsilon
MSNVETGEKSREAFVYLTKLAENSERYDGTGPLMNSIFMLYLDMVANMKKAAQMSTTELTTEERNLLSVAYKNVVGVRRSSWRVVSSIEQRAESRAQSGSTSSSMQLPWIREFRSKVEGEITGICQDIIELLDKHVLPLAASAESKVYYLKMKGDYLRYLSEISVGDNRDQVSKAAQQAYQAATDVASKELPPINTSRLGLALNYSVLYYEILNEPKAACELAQKAFDEALQDIDSVDDATYKDSTMIMQLLKDNLLLWGNDAQEAAPAAEETAAPVNA